MSQRRRARILLAVGMVSSLLAGLAVAESSGATDIAEHRRGSERHRRRRTRVAATSVATTPAMAMVEILPPDESWGGVDPRRVGPPSGGNGWSAMPEDVNPYFDSTGERCGYGQSGPVFILPGNFVGWDD